MSENQIPEGVDASELDDPFGEFGDHAELESEDTPAGEAPVVALPEDFESDVAGEIATDDDGYLTPPEDEGVEGSDAVVVGDYEAGADIAEPTKVFQTRVGRRQTNLVK